MSSFFTWIKLYQQKLKILKIYKLIIKKPINICLIYFAKKMVVSKFSENIGSQKSIS